MLSVGRLCWMKLNAEPAMCPLLFMIKSARTCRCWAPVRYAPTTYLHAAPLFGSFPIFHPFFRPFAMLNITLHVSIHVHHLITPPHSHSPSHSHTHSRRLPSSDSFSQIPKDKLAILTEREVSGSFPRSEILVF